MPEPNESLTITREQTIVIASRIVAAYMLLWIVDDLTLLPREILAVIHEVRTGDGTVLGASYYFRYYILELAANCFRIGLWLMAAGWFYRCGPHIQRFFAGGDDAGARGKGGE